MFIIIFQCKIDITGIACNTNCSMQYLELKFHERYTSFEIFHILNCLKKCIFSKWKVGEEKVSAIVSIPNSKKLLTASKSIKLWDTETKEILKSFTGHSSEVKFLHVISKPEKEPCYVISGSKVRNSC